MAKVYQVNGAEKLENNDVVYVGVRSVAAKRRFVLSTTIGVEQINATQLDDTHKKKYNFIFIVNANDLKNFLKVAKKKRSALSYQKMNDRENLTNYLGKLRDENFEIELVPKDFFDTSEETASLIDASMDQAASMDQDSIEVNSEEGKKVRFAAEVITHSAVVNMEDLESRIKEYQTRIKAVMLLQDKFIGRREYAGLSEIILSMKQAWEKLNESRSHDDLVALIKLCDEKAPLIENYISLHKQAVALLSNNLEDLKGELVRLNDTLHPSVQELFNKSELESRISKISQEIGRIPLMESNKQLQEVRQAMRTIHTKVQQAWDHHQVATAKIIELKQDITQQEGILSNFDLQLGKAEEKNAHFFKGAKEFFTNLFFSKITKEKQAVFRSVLDNKILVQELHTHLKTTIPEKSELENIKFKLAGIKHSLQYPVNVKILQQSRGFTFFGRKVVTTSNQIADKVCQAANALEEKVGELISQVSVVSGC